MLGLGFIRGNWDSYGEMLLFLVLLLSTFYERRLCLGLPKLIYIRFLERGAKKEGTGVFAKAHDSSK